MKKFLVALIILLLGYFAAEHLLARPATGAVSSLLERYDLKIMNLDCHGGFASRDGHCFFELESADVESIRIELSKDRTAQQPVGQLQMQQIGDGGCNSYTGTAVLLKPLTQLGGGSLPYLGDMLLDPAAGHGCLEFSFGYG